MSAWHEKHDMDFKFPFKLFASSIEQFSPHWHEEFEIIYMQSGEQSIGVNGEVYTLVQGDILFIGPGDIHYFLQNNKTAEKIILLFGMSLFESSIGDFVNKRIYKHLLSKAESTKESGLLLDYCSLQKHISDICSEYEGRQQGYRMLLKAGLYDIMVRLVRQGFMRNVSEDENFNRADKLRRLENVFRYMEENIQNDIGLEDAARAANYSIYHFARFFKEYTGLTFSQYLSSARICKAEKYLLNGGHSIIDVAYMSGFRSVKTFNRVFKYINGCSPSEYRRANNEKK